VDIYGKMYMKTGGKNYSFRENIPW